MAARFPFSDFHAFKDYVGFVRLCCPDEFPPREGAGLEDQWTMELAFEGLRTGLRMAAEEKGEQLPLAQGRALVEEAYLAYREGRVRDGFLKLEELRKVLRTVRTV